MSPFLYFLIGLSIGIIIWYKHKIVSNSEKDKLKDQKVRLQQEKEIIVDFMHNLAVAIGQGVERKRSLSKNCPYCRYDNWCSECMRL